MKIVYCIAGTFNSGGMERVLANKANFLANLGHDIIIITTDQKERSSYFSLHKRVKNIDLRVNYIDNTNNGLIGKILSYSRKQKTHRKRLTILLKELKADIVISMFDHEVSFLHKIADGSSKVLEIHFSRFKRIQYGRKGFLGIIDQIRSKNDLILAKKYDRFVVLTQEDKEYWGNLSNILVIPNANTFSPHQHAKLQQHNAIAVGRYDYQKGFDDLIKIWSTISKQFPDWQLNIYGSGELKDEFVTLIKKLELSKTVHLCPPTKEIEKAYLSSSISLMTSRYEGLPMTLLEAQACGVPTVAYACKCGPKDVILSGKNGFLIEEQNKADFVSKLKLLMQDQSLRTEMGENAKLMSHRFSEKEVMQQWLDLFKKLIVTNNDK